MFSERLFLKLVSICKGGDKTCIFSLSFFTLVFVDILDSKLRRKYQRMLSVFWPWCRVDENED